MFFKRCLYLINLVLSHMLWNGGDVLASDTPSDFSIFGRAITRLQIGDNDFLSRRATGLTQSVRLAAEKTITPRLTFLVEGEAVVAIVDKFNDGTGNNPNRLLIPDPNTLELNRLQLQYSLDEQSFLTVGRQILAIDDQRILGATPFRQNTQTFDAVHFSKRFGSQATFQAGYFNKVYRPLGGDNINGRFAGNSYFLTGNIETPLGRLGGFHYALDLESGPDVNANNRASSQTTGVRLDGRLHRENYGVDWEGAYARQRDYADSPLNYDAKYWLAKILLYKGETRFGFSTEVLGGGGEQSFQTPLASLRKFQGFANVFLITPINGVVDIEANFAWKAGTIAAFERVSAKISHHWFSAERGGANYGNETDVTIEGTYRGNVLSVGVASYRASTFATDTTRFFLSLQRHF
ncbi:hypothetical protein [Kordiimonas aquimaris]|uniref:hypothetical protein n=1 Tax=Kordiimonas aquimaris TaxID=707591 RepID=UPI0021D12E3A|nr:hypothetical protein [Kordiimonas aquimaris]